MWVLIFVLTVFTPVNTYASVNDNVGNAQLEILVGDPNDTSTNTLFGLLRQILTVVSTIATAQQVNDIGEQVAVISGKVDGFDSQLQNISATLKNTQAVIGGGCYYTIYTDREYLLGYKLTLTDGTIAKSCYVQRDDSGKYTGVLSVSLSGTITIKVIDPNTKVVQCQVQTPASSNSYATINLDTLLNPKYADILNVNDTLATYLYKDSFFTNSSTYTPTVCNYLAQHQEYLSDFVKSCANVSVTSSNFNTLYSNENEFLSVVGSTAGKWLLTNSTFGNYVANSRSLLRSISFNSRALSVFESTTGFHTYLSNTSLTKRTSTKAGGVANQVSGNLLILSVTSGSRGGSTGYDTYLGRYISYYALGPNHIYLTGTYANLRGDTYLTKSGNTRTIIGATSNSGTTWKDQETNNWDQVVGTTNGLAGYTSLTSCDTTSNIFRFADSVNIASFDSTNISCPNVYVTYKVTDYQTESLSYPVNPQYAGSSTANSAITYIDLDAVN